jgi:hypothetical protein
MVNSNGYQRPIIYGCDTSYHIHITVVLVITCFRSMDGVREHARNHEQQEQVSEIFYVTAEAVSDGPNSQCEEDCPYQGKEKHYHCTWVSFLT